MAGSCQEPHLRACAVKDVYRRLLPERHLAAGRRPVPTGEDAETQDLRVGEGAIHQIVSRAQPGTQLSRGPGQLGPVTELKAGSAVRPCPLPCAYLTISSPPHVFCSPVSLHSLTENCRKVQSPASHGTAGWQTAGGCRVIIVARGR